MIIYNKKISILRGKIKKIVVSRDDTQAARSALNAYRTLDKEYIFIYLKFLDSNELLVFHSNTYVLYDLNKVSKFSFMLFMFFSLSYLSFILIRKTSTFYQTIFVLFGLFCKLSCVSKFGKFDNTVTIAENMGSKTGNRFRTCLKRIPL